MIRSSKSRRVRVALALVATALAGLACGDDGDGGIAGTVPVARVEVTPATAELRIAATVQLTARVEDANGVALMYAVSWSSSDADVASVTSTGLVTGVAPGVVRITATSGGKSFDATVTVLAPISSVEVTPATTALYPTQKIQLSATLTDATGEEVSRAVTWKSDQPGVATVDANGLVTAIAAGKAAITATSEDITGAASITVLGPVASVTVTPAAVTLQPTETIQLGVTLRDATGGELARLVTWVSDAPTVATVDIKGFVTAVAPGVATITATSESQTATATITVRAPTASVTVEPEAPVIYIGQMQLFTAIVRDAEGNQLTRDVTWASSNPGVATIDAAGMVRALAAGSTTITATSNGIVGAANLKVLAPVAAIALSPVSVDVLTGDVVQLTAIPKDAEGQALVRPVAWASDAPAIASVDAGGLVTGVTPGVAHVTATSEGVTSTATITVKARIATVVIAPDGATIAPGSTVQLSAQAFDADGNVLDRTIGWASLAPDRASVSAGGLVTGIAEGSARIVATAGGKADTVVVIVEEPVASILLSSPDDSLDVDGTLQLVAQPRDARGNPLARSVQWESSDPSVATVSAGGLVTGVAYGTVVIRASSGGQQQEVSLTVTPRVATIAVTASNTMLTPEAPVVQVTAELRDARGNVLDRQVQWSTSDAAVATVASTGARTADVTLVASGDVNVVATSEGKTGSVALRAMGPSEGMEEGNNNLSWPVIFADGVTTTGAAVGTDAGLRPLPDEGITVDALPFWYTGNVKDWLGTHYLQGTDNTWRAEWLDGSQMAQIGADVYWGDNLTHRPNNTHSQMHIEVGLLARDVAPMQGFNMFSLSGSGPTEIQGTDGTIGSFQPMVFTAHARLIIEKIDAQGGNPLFTVVDQAVAAGFGQDGPGFYHAELNRAGKIVYGYNFLVKDLVVPDGQTKYGWYRFTFLLDDQVTVGGTPLQRRVAMMGLRTSTEEEPPLYSPQLDSNGRRTFVDIWIASASGGH